MNDRFGTDELQMLIAYHGAPAVSIYMPAHRVTVKIEEDTIRYKNLLRAADEELKASGMRTPEAQELLAPAQAQLGNVEFWQHQSDGLALFLAPGTFYMYRLPIEFNELVTVGENFHIKPLLPLLTNDGTFYVLAVSQNSVRLLRGTRHAVDELDPAGIPGSLVEALPFDEPERQVQLRTTGPKSAPRRGAAMYYGHGGGVTDDEKTRLLRFFHQIDKGLRDVLPDRQVPLIFAGVDYLLPIYREANTYPHLMNEGISGNPDELRPDQLHEAAWQLVAPHFAQAKELALGELGQLASTNQAAYEIRETLPAAYHGRVATAFVPTYTDLWGTFNPETGEVTVAGEERPDTYDLYDQLAVYTLMRGGQVFTLEQDILPAEADSAAVYRF